MDKMKDQSQQPEVIACQGFNNKVYQKNYRRTFEGWTSKAYSGMREKSKKRGMVLPNFTLEEFREWIILNHKNRFNKLFDNWINNGFKIDLIPSINRLDDFKPYTFDNMELITWKENHEKGLISKKTFLGRKLSGDIAKDKLSKMVLQIDKNGIIIKEYNSTREAGRFNKDFKSQSISSTCLGKQKTHKGFNWKYKEDLQSANLKMPIGEGEMFKTGLTYNQTRVDKFGNLVRNPFADTFWWNLK